MSDDDLIIILNPADAITATAICKAVHDDPNYPQIDRDKAWRIFLVLFNQLYGNLDDETIDNIEHQFTGNLC